MFKIYWEDGEIYSCMKLELLNFKLFVNKDFIKCFVMVFILVNL